MESRANLQDKSKDEVIALLLGRDAAAAEMRSKYEAAQARCEITQSKYETAQAEVDKLQLLIKQLQRALFGRRSERLDPGQLQLVFEDVEQSLGTAEAARDEAADDQAAEGQRRRASQPRRNRGALPKHLPREEVVIAPENQACLCCGGALHVIGEDVSEQLDVVPAQLKVKVIRRPRYGCRGCESAVVQAPAPARLIDGGLPTEAMVAHVLVSKYLDHLPLYRQAQIYARQGIELDRATLANWVGRAAWWLRPLHERLLQEIVGSEKIFADDTPVPVLDPGRGRTKTGRLWAYARDDRPWQGQDPPAVAYRYSEDRRHQHPVEHLGAFKGLLQVDAFAGFDRLAGEREDNDVVLAHCWAHTRRKFYEVQQATASPIAAEALNRIAALYKVEAEIRGRTAEQRRTARAEQSQPILDAFKPWLEAQLARISGKSPLSQAIRYTLARWDSLSRFVDDGRIEIDTNTVERTLRPIALGRKNHLFAGSDGGARTWAIVASVIHSARLNDVEPFAYLRDVLERMVQGHPINRIDELLPWSYAKPLDKAA
jgi:transposase